MVAVDARHHASPNRLPVSVLATGFASWCAPRGRVCGQPTTRSGIAGDGIRPQVAYIVFGRHAQFVGEFLHIWGVFRTGRLACRARRRTCSRRNRRRRRAASCGKTGIARRCTPASFAPCACATVSQVQTRALDCRGWNSYIGDSRALVALAAVGMCDICRAIRDQAPVAHTRPRPTVRAPPPSGCGGVQAAPDELHPTKGMGCAARQEE
jgi:hypothetical protein